MRQHAAAGWSRAKGMIFAVAAVLPLCALAQPPDKGAALNRPETVKATQALARWFECTDCEAGQLRAVTRFGQAIVPSLAATLNGGLSPATRETTRRFYAARYEELEKQGRADPRFKMSSTKDEFVALYVDGLDARYRIRAAQALAAIGGTEARNALQMALGQAKRADVQTAIQQSLKDIR
jgi:hypothetical protein